MRVLKETPYPERFDKSALEQIVESIPSFGDDPSNPEWNPTPVKEVDLTSEGYGVVYVKDESVNPTGTHKDRAAWEIVALYRDFAKAALLRRETEVRVPRVSLITAGNAGRALAVALERYGLPPVKLLVDEDRLRAHAAELMQLRADVYVTNLDERELAPSSILELTHNAWGLDLTSLMAFEPQVMFYDWHVHEAFNEAPREIYVPYGSGRLMENYLTWQSRTLRNFSQGKKDPRLQADPAHVAEISIFGAVPGILGSLAEKLEASFMPFTILRITDREAMKAFGATGKDTGIYEVGETNIARGYELMRKHVTTEPSASAGLALYMQRWDEGKRPEGKVLIINTGKGI
ncbi:MAG: PLP-dependent lyase/thiolase [Nanoarchaeota archaeon]|nr:PLP-dependent lyase/thiolase [Nanoarchaeota archaeon]